MSRANEAGVRTTLKVRSATLPGLTMLPMLNRGLAERSELVDEGDADAQRVEGDDFGQNSVVRKIASLRLVESITSLE